MLENDGCGKATKCVTNIQKQQKHENHKVHNQPHQNNNQVNPLVQEHGGHSCCIAAWKGNVTRISETSKWYPQKQQIHYGYREEWSLALSRCPGKQMNG